MSRARTDGSAELGIALPEVVAPLAAYVPAVRTGNLVYTAGQLPMVGGELPRRGKVGAEVTRRGRARRWPGVCALNALAAVDSLVGIDAVTRVVKVVGFVASAPGFTGQPGVINGASRAVRRGVRRGRGARPLGGRGVRVAAATRRSRSKSSSRSRERRSGRGRVEQLEHPAYGLLRPVTETASVLLCDNPGLMTLDGTNTWVLRGPGSDEMVVVDPGPDDDEHIERDRRARHDPAGADQPPARDHTGGIDKIVERTGAVVRSVGSGFLRGLGGPLTDGEVIDAAGLRITVMATPGHTADSVSFLLDDAVLTADTVLGRGTTVIDYEDGSLGDYLESLRGCTVSGSRDGAARPRARPRRPGRRHRHVPGASRGAARPGARRAAGARRRRRRARQIVEHVYTDVDEKLWDVAEWSVQAQLDYLRAELFARNVFRGYCVPRVPSRASATARGGPAARSRRSARSCPRAGSSRGGRSRRAPC